MGKENNQSLPEKMEQLTKLLEKELDLHEQIHTLTKTQAELLNKDDIDAFNSSLDKREKLIEKIKGLHQESEPLMQSYVSVTTTEGNADKTIDNIKKQIREVLEKTAKFNDENIAVMKEKTEEHTKKIDEQRAKGKTIGGYAQSVPNTPEVFDKKT